MNMTIEEALFVINEELLNQVPGKSGIEQKEHYPKTRQKEVLVSLSCLAEELRKSGTIPFQDGGYLYLLRLAEKKFDVEFCFGGLKLPKEV